MRLFYGGGSAIILALLIAVALVKPWAPPVTRPGTTIFSLQQDDTGQRVIAFDQVSTIAILENGVQASNDVTNIDDVAHTFDVKVEYYSVPTEELRGDASSKLVTTATLSGVTIPPGELRTITVAAQDAQHPNVRGVIFTAINVR